MSFHVSVISALLRPVTQRYRFFFCLIFRNVCCFLLHRGYLQISYLSSSTIQCHSFLKNKSRFPSNELIVECICILSIIFGRYLLYRHESNSPDDTCSCQRCFTCGILSSFGNVRYFLIINMVTHDRHMYMEKSILINISLASSALTYSFHDDPLLWHPMKCYLGSFSEKCKQWNKIRQKSWKSWANWRAEYELMQCIS